MLLRFLRHLPRQITRTGNFLQRDQVAGMAERKDIPGWSSFALAVPIETRPLSGQI